MKRKGLPASLLLISTATLALWGCIPRWEVADSDQAPASARARELNAEYLQQLRSFAQDLTDAGVRPARRKNPTTGDLEPWPFVSFEQLGPDVVLAVFTDDQATFDTGHTTLVGRAIHGFNDDLEIVIKAARSAGLLDKPDEYDKLLLSVDYEAADLGYAEASVRKMTTRHETAEFEMPVATAQAFADDKLGASALLTRSALFIDGDLFSISPDDVAPLE